jgi:apolipoprotein D and lipocalin family protein
VDGTGIERTPGGYTMRKLFSALIIMSVFLLACADNRSADRSMSEVEKSIIKNVDLKRYAGVWYEIARYQHAFEKDLVCVTATYTLRDDGRIDVLNQGRVEKSRDKIKKAAAVAWLPDKESPGKLKVRFFWPFTGDYWIINLDEKDYRYVIIASSSRDYLWIMSRTPEMDQPLYDKLIGFAREKGYDLNRLYRVPQDCR